MSKCRGLDRACCPVQFLVVLGFVMAVIGFGPQTVTAQTSRSDNRRNGGSELWIESHALLESITSFDIQDGARAQPQRAVSVLTTSLNGSARLSTRFNSPPTGTPITIIRREIDDLWRLRTKNSSSNSYTRVDYDVIGANGDRGVLSHTSNDRSVIGVRVVELPTRRSDQPNGMGTVVGGVMLEMDLGQAVEAGDYAGSLRITVIQL